MVFSWDSLGSTMTNAGLSAVTQTFSWPSLSTKFSLGRFEIKDHLNRYLLQMNTYSNFYEVMTINNIDQMAKNRRCLKERLV